MTIHPTIALVVYGVGLVAFALLVAYLDGRDGNPTDWSLGALLFVALWPAVLIAGLIFATFATAYHSGTRARSRRKAP